MTNLPSKTVSPGQLSMPAQMSPQFERRAIYLRQKIEHDPFTGRSEFLEREDMPSRGEVELIRARSSVLDHALRPAEFKNALPHILGCFASHYDVFRPVTEESKQAANEIAAIYFQSLQGLPLFSIANACMDYRSGRVDVGHGIPVQAHLAKRAREYLGNFREEQYRLRVILKAIEKPPMPKADRARMLEKLKGLMEELKRQAA